MQDVFVIGIAGGSGSGKSTFAKRLKERFPDDIALVSCDNYYLARTGMPFEERKRQNYDAPEAFEHTDELVVLEGDCIPDDTLFPYMQEMLARYRNDARVGIISGFNRFYEWNCGGNSYCFTKYGATLGWGTWKRVWDNFDFYVKGIQDEYYRDLLKNDIPDAKAGKERIGSWLHAAAETPHKKVNYWDIQFGFVKYSQSYLCIVPKNNLICNIGVGLGSTHTESNEAMNWKPGQILFMPTKGLQLHPRYVICDRNYDDACFHKILHKSFFKKSH